MRVRVVCAKEKKSRVEVLSFRFVWVRFFLGVSLLFAFLCTSDDSLCLPTFLQRPRKKTFGLVGKATDERSK